MHATSKTLRSCQWAHDCSQLLLNQRSALLLLKPEQDFLHFNFPNNIQVISYNTCLSLSEFASLSMTISRCISWLLESPLGDILRIRSFPWDIIRKKKEWNREWERKEENRALIWHYYPQEEELATWKRVEQLRRFSERERIEENSINLFRLSVKV